MSLKKNEQNISGILRPKKSALNYHLNRYLPPEPLSQSIEQFWFVDWDLPPGKQHQQENLPDPNFHLTYEKNTLKLIGPVSKKYTYCMKGPGQILGVKFCVGALSRLLNNDLVHYIDQTIVLHEQNALLSTETHRQLLTLSSAHSDAQRVDIIQSALQPYFVEPLCASLQKVRTLISMIQSNPDITSVEQLSEISNIPTRTIQRYFKKHVGLTPKWLIRKYRLQQALLLLENKDKSILDIIAQLDYTDQSHLIKDFNDILGITPNQYNASI